MEKDLPSEGFASCAKSQKLISPWMKGSIWVDWLRLTELYLFLSLYGGFSNSPRLIVLGFVDEASEVLDF